MENQHEYPSEPRSPFWQARLKLHGNFSPVTTSSGSSYPSSPITPISPLSAPKINLKVTLSSPKLVRERKSETKPFIIRVTANLDSFRPITVLRAGSIFEEDGLMSCLTFTAKSNGVIKGPAHMCPLGLEKPKCYPLSSKNEKEFLTLTPGEPYEMEMKLGPFPGAREGAASENPGQKFNWGIAEDFEQAAEYSIGIVYGKRVGWWQLGDWEEVLGLEEIEKRAVVGDSERLEMCFGEEGSFQVLGARSENRLSRYVLMGFQR